MDMVVVAMVTLFSFALGLSLSFLSLKTILTLIKVRD